MLVAKRGKQTGCLRSAQIGAAQLRRWAALLEIRMTVEGFRADDGIRQIAEAYALDAVDAAKANFGIDLDWSIESIRDVETMFGQLHDHLDEKPSDDALDMFAKAFGSYVGEVIRRKHGGEWGMLALQDEEFPGLSLGIWPWSRAYKRIVNGPEDNIWHYYVLLFDS